MENNNQNILLIYPGEQIAKPRLPMSIITLATHLISNGYNCRMVDERIVDLQDKDIKQADIIGISSMSGAQLRCAVKTAHRIKKIMPDIPLVWGGAHPSAFPEQTAESPLVNCVVKYEGEDTFLKLCQRMLKNTDYSDVEGIAFKRDGAIINNPGPDKWLDMETLNFPRYDLLDIRKYADHEDGLSYETSRGCPFRCQFCYVEYFHKRRWRGKGSGKVLDEVERIKKDLGVKKLFIIDDNFFADKKRSIEICSRMMSSNISFSWSATARADFLYSCSGADMDIIRRSGCEILAIGAESGSGAVLETLKKGITPAQVREAVKKCLLNNIMPTVSFVIGLPFESDDDLRQTLDLYDELVSMGKEVEINGLFIYVPYAGTPIFDIAIKYGYQPKKTLEEWRDWSFSDSRNNPWLKKGLRRKINAVSSIARFKYLYHRFEFYSEEFRKQKLKSPLVKLGYKIFVKIFARIADWRWKHRFFSCAYEWRLWEKVTYAVFKVR